MKHIDVSIPHMQMSFMRLTVKQDVIPQSNTFLKNFRDLLKKIFVYDPSQRITAKEALNHEWFKEMAYNDDGTEAAKIRLERMMRGSQPSYYG